MYLHIRCDYFVLRDEKYVLLGENVLYLTEYARLHLSECTLDFSYKLVSSRTSVRDVDYFFDFVPSGFTFNFSRTTLHSSIEQP